MSWLAWCLGRVGNFEEGLLIAAEDMKRCELSRRPFRVANACMALGVLHLSPLTTARRADTKTAM